MKEHSTMQNIQPLLVLLTRAGFFVLSLPLAAPLVFACIALALRQGFLLDWLMPAELYPVAIAGCVLMVVGLKLRGKKIMALLMAFACSILLLAATQVLAVLTGLASGQHPATGWRLMLVVGMYWVFLATYAVAVVLGARATLRRG